MSELGLGQADAGRREGPHTDGTRYFLADERHGGVSIRTFILVGKHQDAVSVTDFLSMVGMSEVGRGRGLRGERGCSSACHHDSSQTIRPSLGATQVH